MTVKQIDKNTAKDLIVNNHYTHSWSYCRYALGLFDSEDTLIGVATYGFPVGRLTVKSITPDLEKEDVLELTRLWIKDEAPKNTESFFIGQTFKWLRENSKVKVLISYSDPMQNHIGIIYQATNWWYQGNNTMLIKGYMHKIFGELLHPRNVVRRYGTIKKEVLLKIDPNYERFEILKKHRYIYVLNKRDRKIIKPKLKHPILKYPKNNLNSSW